MRREIAITSNDTPMFTASEVESRTGVPATTLRQWERRYGLPNPQRANSGYRLYSQNDIGCIEFMRNQIGDGVAASRAAQLYVLAKGGNSPAVQNNPRGAGEDLVSRLIDATLAGDNSRADRVLSEAHASLSVDHANKIIHRAQPPRPGKVGIISGGGSGHEPLHGGFVGLGMLDAACAGEVFTSPVPQQMMAATKLVDGGAGVLQVVKNYTGDVMNFEMAAEMAASQGGTRVVSVVIDDDVAVQDSTWTAGRRGVGATVLLEKIAGAAAEQDCTLDQVADVARAVNAGARSMGLALTSCTVPAAGKPTFDLGETEMELGVGIHGEPGRRRVPLAPAKDIAAMLLEPILADLPFASGDGVIAFVNGLGGTPLLELYIMFNEVNTMLSQHGITVARSLVGSYITSLDMAGTSITLLKVDDDLLSLWDAPVNTPALRWGT